MDRTLNLPVIIVSCCAMPNCMLRVEITNSYGLLAMVEEVYELHFIQFVSLRLVARYDSQAFEAYPRYIYCRCFKTVWQVCDLS